MKKLITLLLISLAWAADGPKIYISSDMEGVVGAVTGNKWDLRVLSTSNSVNL